MGELLRALRARSVDHPESPALIASWPGVPEAGMHAACTELSRQGHAVRELSIAGPGNTFRRGWAMDDSPRRPAAPPRGNAVLFRELAEPKAVAHARAFVTQFAESKGASETVRSSAALAVSEACSNVVLHAYVDAETPGDVEVRAGVSGDVLVVEVSDDGRGMVPRIDSPGLGLGLPLIAQMTDGFDIVDRRDRPGVLLRMHFNLADPPATDR